MSTPPGAGTGVLDLVWTAERGRASFRRNRYRWPYVVHRLFHPDPEDPARGLTIVQSAGAGLQPGDRLQMTLDAEHGVHVDVRGQGATYVAGVPGGAPAREDLMVRAAAGSAVVVDLAPRILTLHARLVQDTEIAVAPGGVGAVIEAFVIHPAAQGAPDVSYTATTRIVVTGTHGALAVERQSLEGVDLLPDRFSAFATAMVAAPGHLPCRGCVDLLDAACDTVDSYAAASELPGGAGFVVRLAADDGLSLRRGMLGVTAAVARVASHARVLPILAPL